MIGQLSAVPRSGCNWVLTHWGVFPCSIHIGALVPRRSAAAGVPGPRRNADDRDAGWFAPVATRRRPKLAAFARGFAYGSQCLSGGTTPRNPPRGPLWAAGFRRTPASLVGFPGGSFLLLPSPGCLWSLVHVHFAGGEYG